MLSLIQTEWGATAYSPVDWYMPVRKIPKNYRNITGVSAHGKSVGEAVFESSLERDLITLLAFSDEIKRYEAQPEIISWTDDNGKSRTYTPDIRFEFDPTVSGIDATWLVEVKYDSELREKWSELYPKFSAAKQHANQKGWKFHIITDKHIRNDYLKNAKFLIHYRDQIPCAEQMQLVDDYLKEVKTATATEIITHLYKDEWNQAKLITVIWYLVSTFQIDADLNKPITMETPLHWKR